jgi:hypothetical protein
MKSIILFTKKIDNSLMYKKIKKTKKEFEKSGLSIENFILKKFNEDSNKNEINTKDVFFNGTFEGIFSNFKTKKICKNCVHWDVENPRKVGMCLQSKILGGQMYNALGLFTKKDFGCKLFENKKK